MRDVIAEFSYDRFLVGHTNGLDYLTLHLHIVYIVM